jgi:Flp pilus assembly protein CpaB
MSQLPSTFRALLTVLAGWPRRVGALICLVLAILGALGFGGHAAPAALGSVLVASRTLQPGVVLAAADLSAVRWPATAVPAGALHRSADAVGRRVAGALTRGEPIQLGDLLEPAIATALGSGQVATTVTLADPHQVAILARGSRIDLYGTPPSSLGQGSTDGTAVARNALVLAVLPAAELHGDLSPPDTPGLIIATDPTTAGRIAAHMSTPFLATLVPPPS